MCNKHGEMRVNNPEILAIVRKGLPVQVHVRSVMRRLIHEWILGSSGFCSFLGVFLLKAMLGLSVYNILDQMHNL